MGPPVLTEEEWDAVLIDGGTRRGTPFAGSRCDAWRYGCRETATRLLGGTRLGVCDEHYSQLHQRAAALGVVFEPSTRLLYLMRDGEGSTRIWRRRGDQWAEVRHPRAVAGEVEARAEGP